MERIDFSREENQLAAICNPEWHHAPLWKLECLSPIIVEVRKILKIYRQGAFNTNTQYTESCLYRRMHDKVSKMWRYDQISMNMFCYCATQMGCARVEAGWYSSSEQYAFKCKKSKRYSLERKMP